MSDFWYRVGALVFLALCVVGLLRGADDVVESGVVQASAQNLSARQRATDVNGVYTRHVRTTSASFTAAVVSLSTTASQVVAADTARLSLLIVNEDSSLAIRVGGSNVTASANGVLIKAGQATTLYTTGAVYAVAVSGAPQISFLAEKE